MRGYVYLAAVAAGAITHAVRGSLLVAVVMVLSLGLYAVARHLAPPSPVGLPSPSNSHHDPAESLLRVNRT